jgi:hypothetical protein
VEGFIAVQALEDDRGIVFKSDLTFKSFKRNIDNTDPDAPTSTIDEDTLTLDPTLNLGTSFANDFMYKPKILAQTDFYLVSGKVHHLRATVTGTGLVTLSQVAESHTVTFCT